MTVKATSPVSSRAVFLLLAGAAFLLAGIAMCPDIDLAVSGLFYEQGKGFFLADQPVFLFLHGLATYGAWALSIVLLLGTPAAYFRHKPLCGFGAKSWLFLLLGLLIGPGLIANLAFKDHWGRARPHQVTAFGGTETFSPALAPQKVTHKNGSFVAGDAAFGFYLPSFGYVVTRRRSRRYFWGGMGAGILFGLTRIVMGAHFLSDVLFAAFFMLTATATLHAAMFGRKATQQCWRDWIFDESKA